MCCEVFWLRVDNGASSDMVAIIVLMNPVLVVCFPARQAPPAVICTVGMLRGERVPLCVSAHQIQLPCITSKLLPLITQECGQVPFRPD